MHTWSRRAWLGAAALAGAAANAEPLRLPRKLRMALIGLEGHTGEVTGPLELLPDLEIVALADPDPARMERAARNSRLSAARRYTDYRSLLDHETLDIAAVCGSNGERAPGILACAGRKLHIVAEKPLALDRDQLAAVRKAVADAGVRLTMLLPMRFSAPYLALQQVVTSGAIGQVAQMCAQKSYKLGERPAWMRRHASYGGTIPYIGIHMVDLMRFTSGRELVEAVSYQGRIGFPDLRDMENTTATLFRLDNGGMATLHMDYLRPETAPSHGDDRLRLAGTEGVAEYLAATGVTVVTRNEKPRTLTGLPPNQWLFVDFLRSVYLGSKPGLSLEDIYRANEVVLAARESAERRQFVQT